jgi:hypothetical protein
MKSLKKILNRVIRVLLKVVRFFFNIFSFIVGLSYVIERVCEGLLLHVELQNELSIYKENEQ